MSLNKSQTIITFHNLLSMQVKNLVGNTEVQETRPNHLTSLFRFSTETDGLTYALQTEIKTTQTAYTVDVALIEETRSEDNEVHPELVDNKLFEVRELGMKDEGVKLVMKYIRGAIKAVVTNNVPVFDENSAAEA